VLGAAPYVEAEAYLRRSSIPVVPSCAVSTPRKNRRSTISAAHGRRLVGDLTPDSWNIVLGKELAMSLGVTVGDRVTVVVQELRATPMGGVPRMRSFHVVGVFEMGMEQFDSGPWRLST
jgi:lipoprotein-releasing system permease protein